MNVLVIVHLEPDFNPPKELVNKISATGNLFDHVINITSARALTGTEPFHSLRRFHEEEWVWGYEPLGNDGDVEGIDYIATNGHDWSHIADWMKDLSKYDKYTLVGGGRYECLQDVFDIFQHLWLESKIIETLTY